MILDSSKKHYVCFIKKKKCNWGFCEQLDKLYDIFTKTEEDCQSHTSVSEVKTACLLGG